MPTNHLEYNLVITDEMLSFNNSQAEMEFDLFDENEWQMPIIREISAKDSIDDLT